MLIEKIKGKTVREIELDNNFTIRLSNDGEEYIITDSNEVVTCRLDGHDRLKPTGKSINISQRRYKQHIKRIEFIKNQNNINKIDNIKVLHAFYNNGLINLIIDTEIKGINHDDKSMINTNSIYVEYFNILDLLKFDINTMNYIKYIDSNRGIFDTILNNCTINIIQEYEKEGENKWNDYRLTYYDVPCNRYFNHIIDIKLNDKSIKCFNDVINNNKHKELNTSINNIFTDNDRDKLIDAIKWGPMSKA